MIMNAPMVAGIWISLLVVGGFRTWDTTRTQRTCSDRAVVVERMHTHRKTGAHHSMLPSIDFPTRLSTVKPINTKSISPRISCCTASNTTTNTCLFAGLRPQDRRTVCFPIVVPLNCCNASSASGLCQKFVQFLVSLYTYFT